jgi:hypothetical protein
MITLTGFWPRLTLMTPVVHYAVVSNGKDSLDPVEPDFLNHIQTWMRLRTQTRNVCTEKAPERVEKSDLKGDNP